MNEDEFFVFDDNIRTKRFRLRRRDVYLKHLDDRIANSGVLRHTEKIYPMRPDGSSEEIILEHQHRLDCGCLDQKPAAICSITGRVYCSRCVERLGSFCEICGQFVSPEHFFRGPGDKGYCRAHRFHLRRLITG